LGDKTSPRGLAERHIPTRTWISVSTISRTVLLLWPYSEIWLASWTIATCLASLPTSENGDRGLTAEAGFA
jgi:hypothetical protein